MVETLGTRIKQLRLNKQLNQQQLADLLGCTSSVISAYELDSRKPSLNILVKLSKILETSTDYLLIGSQVKTNPNLIDVTALTEREKTAIKQLIEVMKK